MSLLASKRAVIFDMDGVLFQSSAIHADALREVLLPLGIQDFDYATYAGMRTDEVFRRILTTAGVTAAPDRIGELVARKRSIAAQMLRARRPITPGCEEVLRRLVSSHRLALASSASREGVNLFVELSGSATLFESIVSGDDVRDGKPSPDIFSRALEILRERPDNALVIEDSTSGIAAALRAGIDVVGLTGTHSRSDLLSRGATAVIDDIREVPNL